MEKHRQLNDLDFKEQFKNTILDPTLFSHEAHIRLAWIYITNYNVVTACELIPGQILNFATKHGDPDKFNTTVTIAAIHIVDHFIQKSESLNFQDFIAEFPRIKYNFKELLNSHYGFDIFTSKKAKLNYIEPDILSF